MFYFFHSDTHPTARGVYFYQLLQAIAYKLNSTDLFVSFELKAWNSKSSGFFDKIILLV